MSTKIEDISVTASVRVDTEYESNVGLELVGLHIGGLSSPSILVWFDGESLSERLQSIDALIAAANHLKDEARAEHATQIDAEQGVVE